MAAENMSDIKRRMKSISSTKQITKAMELVAGAKLNRAKDLAVKRKNYTATTIEFISRLSNYTKHMDNPYFKENDSNKRLYIILTGDKGLSGGYNSNIIKKFLETEGQKGHNKEDISIISIGSKGTMYFLKNDYEVVGKYININEDIDFNLVKKISNTVLNFYNSKAVGKVYLIYSKFNSVVSQTPTCHKLLPVSPMEEETRKKPSIICEPSGEMLLDYLIPKYITSLLYGAMIDNYAGEQASIRMAMNAATDNANGLIEELNLKYNSARQAGITNEIIEIISGASASN